MLNPVFPILASKRIVLASLSPRRRQLLESIGLKFDVVPSRFEENLDKSYFLDPWEYAMSTASHKVEEVNRRLQQEGNPADIVIGADSVVVQNGVIYEKPADKEDAFRILKELNGKTHTVYTGVVMVNNTDGAVLQFFEGTDVYMTNMSDSIIRAYIETGEPLDKAGAYGIQEQGRTLVERIEGDYFNVVGLPVHALCKNLYRLLGIPLT